MAQEVVPDVLAPVVALLTQFGDSWFLFTLVAILYLTGEERRDDVLLVGALLACAVGSYAGLKFVFELPRPDQRLLDPEVLPMLVRPLYERVAFPSSYGFPSGHATMSTVAYVGLATVLSVWTRRRRFQAAGVAVTVTCLSRVVLGVHYLVDVVAGVALGALVLFVGFSLVDRLPMNRVTAVLTLAVVVNAAFVVESGGYVYAVVLLGATLGAFASWQLVLLGRELDTVDHSSAVGAEAELRVRLVAVATLPLVVALASVLVGGVVYPVAGLAGFGTAAIVLVPVVHASERGI